MAGCISWTEKEVRFAQRLGKRILPYKKAQEPPPTILDLDKEKQEALEKFETFFAEKIAPSIPRFSDMLELVGLAVRDVTREVVRIEQQTEREEYEGGFLG